MIEITSNPNKNTWPQLLKRPMQSSVELFPKVQAVLEEVKNRGDQALFEYTEKFDGVKIDNLKLDISTITLEDLSLDKTLIEAIKVAAFNISLFHQRQKQEHLVVETMPGVKCERKSIPIQKVGLYIPGGTAPLLSTVLMLAIPAKIAGCKEIVLCTPPDKLGNINPAIIAAARIAGIETIYKIGGAQAIAAMAYGTETVPRTYKIFGPGNQYVTAAKQLVSLENVAIDMPAGPSELAVYADSTSNPAFVASDLLSQAEHGLDSQVLVVSTSISVAESINAEIEKQIEELPRKDIAKAAISKSLNIVLSKEEECIELLNEYAAEHLILSVNHARVVAQEIYHAGSIFLGHFTPESAGDYASGTNHTLPTNGTSVAYSGVSLDSFVKKVTLQEITEGGMASLGPHIEVMAEAELLQAHKNAVTLRLKALKTK